MKHILILLIAILPALTNAHSKAARSYMPSVGDYVKPKSWSAYEYPYIGNWTDPTGNLNPYHTYMGWVNKRCLVTSLWLVGSQWYVQLNIPGTQYIVNWPVNYVSTLPPQTVDFLTPTI